MGDLLSPGRELHVVGAAIPRSSARGVLECLVAQRSPSMREPGRWEFPGGKIERGESPETALAREIAEELGCRIEVLDRIGTGRAESHGSWIRLDVYGARLLSGEPEAREHSALRWEPVEALSGLVWAPADVPVVPAVVRWIERLRRESEA